MQFYVISDNLDTQMGLRLIGVPGVIVHEEAEVRAAIDHALADPEIAIILITEKLVRLCRELVYDIKLNHPSPLIVEIPDRHATSQITTTIDRYVSEAIGVHLT